MINSWDFESLDETQLDKLCARPRIKRDDITRTVQTILDNVRKHGDEAVLELTEKFDGVRPNPLLWPVRKPEEIPVKPEVQAAYKQSFENIFLFHKAQIPQNIEVQTMPGIICRRESRPIERIGLYIPGGSAPMPSTALMLGVPALLAGCPYKILATPPDKSGKPLPEIELAASLTGISHIYLAGGAQAIAAMAWGTASIRKVDKVFGPGNQFVTAAKMLLQNSDAIIGIDLPAGPSEVMVVADSGADPEFIASDLLSQAEHGADSQVVLVAIGNMDLEEVNKSIKQQLTSLPRADIANKALEHSYVVRTRNRKQAVEMINRYAPEHLILQLKNAEEITPAIQHAGSVFLGPWTPESAGDYASGTNHTLPTYGYARMYSGVSVDSFLKFITFQQLDRNGLETISPTVIKMAEVEGLHAHVRAITARLKHSRSNNPTKF
ncbi:MAG: histidinol dehydrogenase [Balneolales bacterium]